MFRGLAANSRKASTRFAPLVLGGLGVATGAVVYASDEIVPPPHNHWSHSSNFSTLDTASLRRGYEVYRQVCSTCHSLKLIHFRNLVGVTHTEAQAVKLAASFEVPDGPNEEGEMFTRKGKLPDRFPSPYPNDEFARNVNNGSLPPDLSCISKARHSGPDYIYALLTGYDRKPPAGYSKPGLYYNPYFDGGALAMKPPLTDGQIEYEDGTPATVSQMAKDVSTFLLWCSEPETDARRKAGFQFIFAFGAMVAIAGYYKRFAFASSKTRRISWFAPR